MTLEQIGAILLMAGAVYVPKVVPLVLVGEHMPGFARRWLAYVAPAVLGALVAPSIFPPAGGADGSLTRMLPFLATFVVVVTSRNMLLAVGAGLIVLVALVAFGRIG